MRYRRVYKMLIAYGHDATKALEIVLDARRKDKHALCWIRTIRRNHMVQT